MPLYEYACTKCDHHFDVRHSANETPALSCPKCTHGVRKVFHPAGIIFKGSGWHIKDYASKNETSATGPSEAAKPKSDSTPAPAPAAAE